MALNKCLSVRGNDSGISAKTALPFRDDRILGVRLEINHRREVEVKTNGREIARYRCRCFSRRRNISSRSKRFC